MQTVRVIRTQPPMSVIDCQPVDTYCAPATRETKETLRAQTALLMRDLTISQFLEFIPDPAMVLNRARQIVLANKHCLDSVKIDGGIIGKRPGEAMNCIKSDTKPGGSARSKNCRHCGLTKAILKGYSSAHEEECHITVHGSCTIKAMEIKASASPFESDGLDFVVLVLTDISREKRMRYMEKVFYHESLNTAIAMRGYAELAATEELDDITKSTFLHRTADLADHIIDELNSQRMLLAAENDELAIKPVPLDSLDVLQRITDSLAQFASNSNVALELATNSESVDFWSDRMLLLKVMGHTIKNAIEASSPGDVVTAGCETSGAEVCFWVHNPAYMPEPVQLQIFNRSFSTKDDDRGLGTYAMKYLTEKYLGGVAEFWSNRDTGTRFSIRLGNI